MKDKEGKKQSEDGLYKVIYKNERKGCSKSKCDKTCPAYLSTKIYHCGVRSITKKLTETIRSYLKSEAEKLKSYNAIKYVDGDINNIEKDKFVKLSDVIKIIEGE